MAPQQCFYYLFFCSSSPSSLLLCHCECAVRVICQQLQWIATCNLSPTSHFFTPIVSREIHTHEAQSQRHCNEKPVTSLGTDGSPKVVPTGFSGPLWDHDENHSQQYVCVLLRLTLNILGPFPDTGQNKVGTQTGPRIFCRWSQLRPNPNYQVPIRHWFHWKETWDHLGTSQHSKNRNFLNCVALPCAL